eukprot:484690-Pleurochrysis_carterae.AAC.2
MLRCSSVIFAASKQVHLPLEALRSYFLQLGQQRLGSGLHMLMLFSYDTRASPAAACILIVGAELDPPTSMRLQVLRWWFRRGKPYAPAIYCKALLLNAVSGRGDYGRAPATSGTHNYTVRREANKSPLDQGVAMRFGVSTQQHEETAQRRMIHANAKTCTGE